jgi:hypothetical protein
MMGLKQDRFEENKFICISTQDLTAFTTFQKLIPKIYFVVKKMTETPGPISIINNELNLTLHFSKTE